MIMPINSYSVEKPKIESSSPCPGTTVYKCPYCGFKFLRIKVDNIHKCDKCGKLYLLDNLE